MFESIDINDQLFFTNISDEEAASTGGGVNVPAGPIWSNEDAQVKCPAVAAAAGGRWDGNWVTTIWGQMSVCNVV